MILTLGLIVFISIMIYVLFGNIVQLLLKGDLLKKWVNRLAGTILIGFGIDIGFSDLVSGKKL